MKLSDATAQHDLPFLWALYAEVQAATSIILADDEFAYLRDKFTSRRCPQSTRLFYAMSKLEDDALRSFCSDLKDAFCTVRISCYIFDGVIALFPQPVAPAEFQAVLDDIHAVQGVKWVPQIMGAPPAEPGIGGAPDAVHGMGEFDQVQTMMSIPRMLAQCGDTEFLPAVGTIFTGHCLETAACYAAPGMIPANVFTVHDRKRPMNVRTLNSFALRLTASEKVWQLEWVKGFDILQVIGSGDWFVCLQYRGEEMGHFWAVLFENDTKKVVVIDDALRRKMRVSPLAFFQACENTTLQTAWFKPVMLLRSLCGMDVLAQSNQGPYAQVGLGDDDEAYRTPLAQCVCCGGRLVTNHEMQAVRYGFQPPTDIVHASLRCDNRSCRKVYGYNFVWDGGAKRNTLKVSELVDGVLFVNDKVCFDVSFLKYHAMLQFRNATSYHGVTWAFERVFGTEHARRTFRRLLSSAIALFNVMKEFEEIGSHTNVYIDTTQRGYKDERHIHITDEDLQKYDEYLHKKVFPGKGRQSVKEIAMDGNQKVMFRCSTVVARAGKPKKDGSSKKFVSGWFMAVSPRDSRVLAAEAMIHPENNEIKLATLLKVIHRYPKCDCLIHDRNCSFEGAAKKVKELKQLKYFPIDKWHGTKHCKECKNHPDHVRRLKMRLRGVNTSVSEQVFSWFKMYARIFNEMTPSTHRFFVLYFCRLHNACVQDGDAEYLNAFSSKNKVVKKRPSSYACAPKKKPACKVMKVRKVMKVMKVK